jgi:hypothetical protein
VRGAQPRQTIFWVLEAFSAFSVFLVLIFPVFIANFARTGRLSQNQRKQIILFDGKPSQVKTELS